MDLGISGRRALVAGGSAGMGRAVARVLAKEGVDVVISARSEERLKSAAAAISEEAGREVRYVRADHSTREGRAAMLEACSTPDILITTLSPPRRTCDFLEIEADEWAEAFSVCAIGPIELMRAVSPGMASRNWGRIVNITTSASKFPREIRLLSGAPRAALANYVSVVARKMSAHNVIINNLLPGLFVTEGMRATRDWSDDVTPELRQQREREYAEDWGIPCKRMGNADDFGHLAASFCAEFANFIIGQNIVIDGGSNPATF